MKLHCRTGVNRSTNSTDEWWDEKVNLNIGNFFDLNIGNDIEIVKAP